MKKVFLPVFVSCLTLPTVLNINAQNNEKFEAIRLNELFRKSKSWALKAIILIALSDINHPESVKIFEEALSDRVKLVNAYAIECLSSMKPKVLKSGADKDLIDHLINKDIRNRNDYYQKKAIEVVEKITGQRFEKIYDYKSWWRDNKESWTPDTWVEEKTEQGNGEQSIDVQGTGVQLVEDLFILNENGLEIAILLDATGSMQPTIDAARDGIDELAKLLQSIIPDVKMALIIYKDLMDTDVEDGAKVLVPLTSNYRYLKSKLEQLHASGGGDAPERVEKAMERALNDRSMRWSKGTGKALVIIGDAPPHDSEIATCRKLAKEAHTNPLGMEPRTITTGGSKKDLVYPFVVSAIGVSPPGFPVATVTRQSFREIASAGGGTYATLTNQRNIVQSILTAAFGKKWEKQIGRFIELYYKLKDKGL